MSAGLVGTYEDVWLVDGIRTPFADYNGVLGLVSPIDLGIKAARALFAKTGIAPTDVGSVIGGCMAQASFDAYLMPRHSGLYSGVPIEVPAHLVQRVCGTGIELVQQAADAIALGRTDLVLCVGAESMSRNPVAAYTHRGGFKMGQIEFKDFLWESLTDPAAKINMGGTAENLARKYGIGREAVDAYAAESFSRAIAAQTSGFLAGEITPLVTEKFELEGYESRGISLPRGTESLAQDTHIRPTSLEVLAKIRPAFGGVQTGGNSSAVVDGGAAALIAAGRYVRDHGLKPLAKVRSVATVGVEPEIMGIGPVPAIQALLAKNGLTVGDIDRVEINEAFAAQIMACEQVLGLDHEKVNVNGGAIAIGHPLAVTGVRLATTLSRELRRSGGRFGIASACIGGGQGIAMLVEAA